MAVLTEREVIRSSCWSSVDLQNTYSFKNGSWTCSQGTVSRSTCVYSCALHTSMHASQEYVVTLT